MIDEVTGQDPHADLEARKRSSLAQVLFKAARLFNEQALERVRERTGTSIRASHTALFPHIDHDGTRLTTLAARLGISKQAVGQLVTELEVMGTLERVPDPDDGRAKLVRFVQRNGRSSIHEGLDLLIEFEKQIAEGLGPRATAQLHKHLLALLDILEAE